MKHLIIGILGIIFFQNARSQDVAFVPNLQYQLEYGPLFESPAVDTTAVTPKRKLLPDNMSLMERSLWGESGLFRSVGLAAPLTPEVRKSELGLRRTMLSIHQIGGFVTLGLMISTVYYGQLVLNGHRQYLPRHKAFVAATIVSYTATGLLSVMSPPPLIRRDEISTTTIHKTLAWVHFLGMVVTPIIGKTIKHSSNINMAHYHQVSAYITTGALAASMIVVTF
jgi:hypothetical protein